jgi:20S proteasome subunit alpha 6
MGIAIAGLASDARVLSNFMKQQCLASKMTYGRPMPIERIVNQIGDRAQTNTQHYGKRPYGVGLLVLLGSTMQVRICSSSSHQE